MAEDSGGGSAPTLGIALVSVLSALVGAGASLGTTYLMSTSKSEELKVHLVEIAIGILRAEPEGELAGARGWAVDVISKNSGVPISNADRDALRAKRLPMIVSPPG